MLIFSLELSCVRVSLSKHHGCLLGSGAAAALAASRPVLPGVSTPGPDFLGTSKVG